MFKQAESYVQAGALISLTLYLWARLPTQLKERASKVLHCPSDSTRIEYRQIDHILDLCLSALTCRPLSRSNPDLLSQIVVRSVVGNLDLEKAMLG
jgi:hypothetical protein